MLKSNFSSGNNFEKIAGHEIHQRESSYPLLVSSLVLREFGCGQIDVASIATSKNNFVNGETTSGKLLEIYEVKMSGHISKNQIKRLTNSCDFLIRIFQFPARLFLRGPNGTIRIL